MVILTVGGNDIMKVVKKNFSHLEKKDFIPAKLEYEHNLMMIMDTIRHEDSDIPIVLIGLYNPFYVWFANVKEMDEILIEWNDSARNVVSSFNDTYFVHIDEIFKNTTDNVLHKDYFHPNDLGYSLIAERLHETVASKTLKDLNERQYTAVKGEK